MKIFISFFNFRFLFAKFSFHKFFPFYFWNGSLKMENFWNFNLFFRWKFIKGKVIVTGEFVLEGKVKNTLCEVSTLNLQVSVSSLANYFYYISLPSISSSKVPSFSPNMTSKTFSSDALNEHPLPLFFSSFINYIYIPLFFSTFTSLYILFSEISPLYPYL